MSAPRPGQSRPRCARCPSEVRPRSAGDLPAWEHVDPPADGHAAVYDVGILSHVRPERGHKEEMNRELTRDLPYRAPEGYPGTTGKVLPEDWEYS